MNEDFKEGRAIIDSVINIRLLLWAFSETKHKMYRDVAIAHAETTAKYFIREDATVCHSFLFDTESGEVIRESNNCGYSDGSYWARGCAWATYGFAMTARYTDNDRYYDIALKLIKKYISTLDDGRLVPPWDFRLPAQRCALCQGVQFTASWDESLYENRKYNVDTSAAIMACAAMELDKYKKCEELSAFAVASLGALCSDEYLNTDESVPAILSHQNGCMSYATYGDFFFVQGLQTYLYGKEVCW